MLLGETLPVRLRGNVSIAEAVLHSGSGADVLVEELLPRLLRDGLGGHDSAG